MSTEADLLVTASLVREADNLVADLPAVTAIVEACEGVLGEMSPF